MKQLFSFLTVVLFSTSLFAYDFEVDGIYYNFKGGDSVEVTSSDDGYFSSDEYGTEIWINTSYSGSVTIPETVEYNNTTYRVTIIGHRAFDYCSNLTAITIPNGVTTIGENTFCGCSSLAEVTIPNSVTTIDVYAFCGCSSLFCVTIPNSVTAISDWVFCDCYNLMDIRIPDGVTTINYRAFSGCSSLSSITIPNSVTTIGDFAFSGCSNLTEVTIPNSVTSIGNSAFSHCYFTAVTIPNSVTSIGTWAFSDSFTPVYNSHIFAHLPTGHVGVYSIPDGLISIAGAAFYACYHLTEITIPASITAIGDYAFQGCSDLCKISCLATIPPTIGGSNTFYNIDYSIPLYVPAQSIEAYKTAEYWSKFTNIQALPITNLKFRVNHIALYPNEKYFLNTVVAPAEADKSMLIWTSSDMDIATVDSTGFVTAHAVGTTQIIVSTPDKALSDTCEVVVLDENQAPTDDVVVDPNDRSVEITWTPVDGAAYYVFVVYADESQVTKICTLTFNAWGHLTNIHFLPKKHAAMPENNPFNFTVTGLETSTTYGYSMSSYDETETLLTSKAGLFTTTSNIATAVETLSHSVSNEVHKVLENGTLYILRNGEKYTIDGRKVSSM